MDRDVAKMHAMTDTERGYVSVAGLSVSRVTDVCRLARRTRPTAENPLRADELADAARFERAGSF